MKRKEALMPNYFSGHWIAEGGCTKHAIPEIPCPQCLATADPDLQVTLTEIERQSLAMDPELSVRDLFPEGEVGDKLCAMAM